LSVTDWDPGDRAARYFGGFGAGEGHIVVEVEVRRPGETAALEGQVRAYVSGGFLGGESSDAVRAAAVLIGDAIATGVAR
jgi:hypothetical protein